MRRLNKVQLVVLLLLLALSLTGCNTTKVKEPVDKEKLDSRVNSSIVKVNECQFKIKDSFLGDYLDSCDIYLDTLTKSYYAKFHSTYNGVLIKLVNSDGTPKLYSKDNKNELVLVEQGEFFVFEDTDTSVQYIVTGNYSDYTVRGVIGD